MAEEQQQSEEQDWEQIDRWLRARDVKVGSSWNNRMETAMARQADAIITLAQGLRLGETPEGLYRLLELMAGRGSGEADRD